jgi:hypothetical protein
MDTTVSAPSSIAFEIIVVEECENATTPKIVAKSRLFPTKELKNRLGERIMELFFRD